MSDVNASTALYHRASAEEQLIPSLNEYICLCAIVPSGVCLQQLGQATKEQSLSTAAMQVAWSVSRLVKDCVMVWTLACVFLVVFWFRCSSFCVTPHVSSQM